MTPCPRCEHYQALLRAVVGELTDMVTQAARAAKVRAELLRELERDAGGCADHPLPGAK